MKDLLHIVCDQSKLWLLSSFILTVGGKWMNEVDARVYGRRHALSLACGAIVGAYTREEMSLLCQDRQTRGKRMNRKPTDDLFF